MKLTRHKIFSFMLAAAFALTLAGCGGGGGTAAVEEPPMEMPEPTAQEICEGDGGRYEADGSCTSAADVAAEMAEATALSDAKDAAMAAYTAAMAAVYAAVDPVAQANAHMYAAMAGTANEAAQAATTSADAMTHQTAAETASASAVEAGMTRGLGITKLANAAANKSAIDSAALVGTPAPAPISNAGRVGQAIRDVGRNSSPSNAEEFGTVDGPTVDGSSANVTVTTTHNGNAPRFTLMRTLPASGATATALARGEAPTALMMRGGWAGAELVGSMSGGDGYKENALVFTDINAPQQSYISDATNARHLDDTELAADTSVNTAVVSGDIPSDGSHFTGTYNAAPADNNPPASGRFFCPTGTACSISVDASGVLKAIQGYTFQPVDANVIVRQDSDYLSWGVWLHVPNVVPGPDVTTAAATVAAFAYGSRVFQVNAALTGTATYNGVAAGLYTAGGMVEYFDADVTLEADFGGRSANDSTPTTAANDSGLLGAVSGAVTNIKAGGMDVDGMIRLGRAALIAGDDPETIDTAEPATRFRGATEGNIGGRSLTGAWGGRFYGPNKAPAGSVAVRSEFPTTAAGTFGAGTTRSLTPAVAIVGSFGAWKAE